MLFCQNGQRASVLYGLSELRSRDTGWSCNGSFLRVLAAGIIELILQEHAGPELLSSYRNRLSSHSSGKYYAGY